MHFYIKNMVCPRCVTAVRNVFESAGAEVISVELGEVNIKDTLQEQEIERLGQALKKLGFELINNRKSRIIELIKSEIITLVHHSDEMPNTNLSTYLADNLNYDYTYLSNLFSEIEGTTIEKYHIAQRIEKVKELLVYDELSLSQIADKLGYSSSAYLSSQFKKITGLTPTFYKSVKDRKRKNIDNL
ncbi:MAG: helix-turn-helix domain-containing protein [Sphingobacteriales bacterium]|nr:MAG: helix-turn-helix domain-containing protein [Sphingobacteriales bacterium]